MYTIHIRRICFFIKKSKGKEIDIIAGDVMFLKNLYTEKIEKNDSIMDLILHLHVIQHY